MNVVSAVEVLRSTEPTVAYERITLRSGTAYENTSILNGGTFYYDPGQTAADNTGLIVVTAGGKRWVRVKETARAHVSWFRESTDTSWYEALTRLDAAMQVSAFPSRFQAAELPSGTFGLHRPYVATPNWDFHFYGSGGKDRGTVVVPTWSVDSTDYASYGLFHQVNTAAGNVGFSVHNIQFNGQRRMCHGIYRMLAGHFVEENCSTLNFNGAGIAHYACQDMDSDTEVQGCGRTSGSLATLADVSDMSKTTFAPVEIGRGGGNSPNYCRYRCKQVEANFVSPYVRIDSAGGYCNSFKEGHTEQRTLYTGFDSSDYGWATLFYIVGGEWNIDDWGSVQLNTYLNMGPYTQVRVTNVSRGGAIVSSGNNTQGNLWVTSSAMGSLNFGARSGVLHIDNCYFSGNVTLTYIGWDLGFSITNTYFSGTFTATNDGGSNNHQRYIENCIFVGDFSMSSVSYMTVKNCQFDGGATFQCPLSEWIWNRVVGTETIYFNSLVRYIPWNVSERYGIAPPTAGTNAVGSKVWNSVPAAGGTAGWVCIAAGNPGTWKAFGAINS